MCCSSCPFPYFIPGRMVSTGNISCFDSNTRATLLLSNAIQPFDDEIYQRMVFSYPGVQGQRRTFACHAYRLL